MHKTHIIINQLQQSWEHVAFVASNIKCHALLLLQQLQQLQLLLQLQILLL